MMENKIFAKIRLRLLAGYLDYAILALPITFLLWYAGTSYSMPVLVQRLFLLIIIWLPFGILSLLHPIFFTHYFGGTVGKLLTGLKVIDEHGKYLSLKRSFFRHTVGYQFSGILFGLGFLAIIKDPQKQGWHDKAVGSKVIVEKRKWPLALLMLLALIILNLYILYSAFNTAFSGPLPEEFKAYMKSFETKQEKQPVSNWQTYRNEEYGFEIKYPTEWRPVEITDGLGRKQLYSLGAPGAQYNGFSVGGYPYEKSVDDFFDEQKVILETAEGANYILSEVKDTIVGGERAIEIPNLSNAKYYEEKVIFVEHNGFIYQIIVPTRFESFDSIVQVGEEETKVFDQILPTFRFTK